MSSWRASGSSGNQSQSITVRLPNDLHQKAFGQLFGEHFLKPLVPDESSVNAQALVVAAYGEKYTGKTTFLKAAAEAVLPKAAFFRDVRFHTTEIYEAANGRSFRKADFGLTSIGQFRIFDEERAPYIPKFGYEGDFKPRGSRETGIDFLEHPLAPYLRIGGAIILSDKILGANQPTASEKYFRDMRWILEYESTLKSPRLNTIYKRLRPMKEVALTIDSIDRFRALMDERRKGLSAEGAEKNQEPAHFLNVVLTKGTGPARDAFAVFRAQAVQAFDFL